MIARSPSDAKPLMISMGDPAGIGPEVVVKALAALAVESRSDGAGLPPLIVVGCPAALGDAIQLTGAPLRLSASTELRDLLALDRPHESANAEEPWPCAVLNVGSRREARFGHPSVSAADVTVNAIEASVQAIANGDASGLVTAPIAKAVLYEAGFSHPGQTEFLGALAQKHWPSQPAQAVMMLASPELRVVPTTIHVPLADVPRLLTTELIVSTARIVHAALRTDFAIPHPRLVLTGLNPHAGEDGALGSEDAEVIAPAVAALRVDGIDVRGPLPADTIFHARARATYDAAICMYHDQANIPIKALDFDGGVNTTLGLPFVRTSPDHGTAFDIAGRGIARADSMMAAIRLAATMVTNRAAAI